MENLERKEEEDERRREQQNKMNQQKLRDAERRQEQPIDDSAVVDDMFGFLEEQKDSNSDAPAPSAFRDLPAPKNIQNGELIMGVPTVPEDHEENKINNAKYKNLKIIFNNFILNNFITIDKKSIVLRDFMKQNFRFWL